MTNERNKDTESQEGISPFWLQAAFPDAQGIFDARHRKLEEIKSSCFIALDANVLLLPYKLEDVSLPDVVGLYKPLAKQGRLVIPAQSAREFAKHRSAKVAELVKYLRDQASLSGPVLKKKVGALTGHAGYDAAMTKTANLAAKIKEVQSAINTVADEIAADVGEDPVSIAYRELFVGTVRADPADCVDEALFNADLKLRYQTRRPPGYKDQSKDDSGAGDLIIWKTILEEGASRRTDCIFVTGEEKPDWHVQSNGPFQPRLELLEEYRAATGKTLHIIPLSRLLKLYEASAQTVEKVRKAETVQHHRFEQQRLDRYRNLMDEEARNHYLQMRILEDQDKNDSALDRARRQLGYPGYENDRLFLGDDDADLKRRLRIDLARRMAHLRNNSESND